MICYLKFFIFFGIFVLYSQSIYAEPKAVLFEKKLAEEISATLQTGDISKANAIFFSRFDLKKFTQRCLVDHWSEFSESEKERVTQLLSSAIQKKILKKLNQKKETNLFNISPQKTLVDKEGLIWISNILTVKAKKIKFVLALSFQNPYYRIVDYEVEGALLSRNYRGQFNNIFRKQGKNALIKRLEEMAQ